MQHKVILGLHLVMESDLPHQVQTTQGATLMSLGQARNTSPIHTAPEGQSHIFVYSCAEEPLTMNLVFKLLHSY